MTFTPYVKPGLRIYGAAEVAAVRGGVYATGTVANTYLELAAGVVMVPELSGFISGTLILKPFEYEIGLWYEIWKCSLKWKKMKLRLNCGW